MAILESTTGFTYFFTVLFTQEYSTFNPSSTDTFQMVSFPSPSQSIYAIFRLHKCFRVYTDIRLSCYKIPKENTSWWEYSPFSSFFPSFINKFQTFLHLAQFISISLQLPGLFLDICSVFFKISVAQFYWYVYPLFLLQLFSYPLLPSFTTLSASALFSSFLVLPSSKLADFIAHFSSLVVQFCAI